MAICRDLTYDFMNSAKFVLHDTKVLEGLGVAVQTLGASTNLLYIGPS